MIPMGKKILALGMIVCLVAGFAGCSRKFSAIWQWNSSKHSYYAFNIDEKNGFSVIYNNNNNQDDIYISRYDVNGNLSWDKKFEKGILLNGIYIFSDSHSCTLVDYESGEKIATVQGELLPDKLDGKSLLFERIAGTQTGTPEHSLVKTDLKGNQLWKTSIPSDGNLYVHSCDEKLVYLDDYENNSYVSNYSTIFGEKSYGISKNESDLLENIDTLTRFSPINLKNTFEKKTETIFNFYQLDLENGKLVKHTQFKIEDNVEVTDLSDESWNLLISKPGMLQMYNCIEGKVVWSTKLDVKGIVAVAPRGGIILVDLGSEDKSSIFACINFKNGQEMWRKNIDRNTPINASIIKDKIVIGFENVKEGDIITGLEGGNKVLCCDISSGKTLWTKEGDLFNGGLTENYFSHKLWNWKPKLYISLNVSLDKNDNSKPETEYSYETSYVDSKTKDPTISGKYVAIEKNMINKSSEPSLTQKLEQKSFKFQSQSMTTCIISIWTRI